MFSLDIDVADLDRIAARFAVTEKQIKLARTRALRKTLKKVETEVKKQASKSARIPLKGLGRRFFAAPVKSEDNEAKLWIGAYHVSPFAVGRPEAYGNHLHGGVRVSGRGGRDYQGAFLAQIYTSHIKVWIRLRSRHYSKELYPTRYRPGDRGMARHHRFPVVRAAIPVEEHIAAVLVKQKDTIAQEFKTIFSRELNYEMTKAG